MKMDAISRIQPVVEAVDPNPRRNRLNDPILEGFLDYIDRYVAESRERRKIETEVKLEARRLQAEYDRKLAFLQGMVEAARQTMLGAPNVPGGASNEEKAYYFWLAQLQGFKQQGRIASVL
jgi:hypothetical protein